MVNIVLPVVNDEMAEFVKVASKLKDSFLLVGITKKLQKKFKFKNKENLKVVVYNDCSLKEQMINGLQQYLKKGDIIIARKPITAKELQNFQSSQFDISTCFQKCNKFKNFVDLIWQKIAKSIFGFSFYNGDISVIAFKEKLFKILKDASNLSYITRVNKWKGIDEGMIDVKSLPIKKEYDKINLILTTCAWCLSWILNVVGIIAYCLNFKVNFLILLLLIALLVLVSVAVVIVLFMIYMNIKIGKRSFEKIKKGE